MPLNSIHNIRGFFSDYWLGSILSGRKAFGPRLTAAQAGKKLWRLMQLRQRVDSVESLDVTRFRERFARPLFEELLGFAMLEGAEDSRLRFLARLKSSENGPAEPSASADASKEPFPLVALLLCPDPQGLDLPQTRKTIEYAMLEHSLPYGFVVTAGTVRLVRTPGNGPKGACLDFSLTAAVEQNDVDSLSAAYRVFCADNFVPENSAPPPIELLEEESRKHSAKVSEDLKAAVFTSAEILIGGFLADIRDRSDAFPSAPSLTDLRDAALQTLYRLLFILYAESRDERLQTHSLYRDSYSLEKAIDSLLRRPETELPGNRTGLWLQLLALFKIFDEGVPPMPGFENIPPRGGTLFSDETPEGSLIARLRLPDRVIGRLLLTLATTLARRGVGRERVSFRELEIEQLGAVYEGLLEYEPRTAGETMLEARVQGREFVLTPSDLRRLCEQKELHLKGDAAMVEGTPAASLHTESLEGEEQGEDDLDEDGDAEESDASEAEEENRGVKRGAAARLVRRLEPGEFYFVPGSARKASGSYYTREEIVQYLVRNALEDSVEGTSAAKIESLRIIDMACGSAHFLVGAARYLGRKLLDTYNGELKGQPPVEFYPDRRLDSTVRERWEHEGEQWCKRRIIERCLFGVDLNPTAVQLAQVALWIESLAGDRPLSFFSHHIRCGNSLLGTRVDRLHRPPHPLLGEKLDAEAGGLFELDVAKLIGKALDERHLIDAPLPAGIRRDTPEEYEYKADRLRRAEEILRKAKLLFDLRSAAPLIPEIWNDWTRLVSETDLETYSKNQKWWAKFVEVCKRERFFHWELEFPEAFRGERRGFDAVLGNPPWDKVLPARTEFYGRKDILIRAYSGNELDKRIKELHSQNPGLEAEFKAYQEWTKTLAQVLRNAGDFPLSKGRTQAAHEDISKFFLELAIEVTARGGAVGMLLPSMLYNGDGYAGLREWLLHSASIGCFYAFENRHKLFPIDSRYKFVCLGFSKVPPNGSGFTAAFMRHDPAELADTGPHAWEVNMTVDEVKRLSPRSLAFLEYRSPRDQEIIRKMYQNSVTLDGPGAGSWGAEMFTDFAHIFIYNTNRDKDLWTDPRTGRLYDPRIVLGAPPNDPVELVQHMRRLGFCPVYEGKHMEQFIYGTKPIRWWLRGEHAEAKYGRRPLNQALLVFRDTASNTNQRTCIAAILPVGSAASETLAGIITKDVDVEAAAVVLNSFSFDYALRMRTAGTHVSFTYVRPMPVPPSSVVNNLPRVSTICGWSTGCELITDRKDLWETLWKANRAVAEAYGLNASDFAHILESFPAFARKRAAFYAYMQKRVEQWKREERA